MKNNNHKLENMENGDLTRSRSASNGVNNKTNIKVWEGKYDHYGHPTAIMIGLVIFAMAAVWVAMPAGVAEAAL